MPYPWQCSKPGWMGLWAIWSEGGVPAHGRGWALGSLPTQNILIHLYIHPYTYVWVVVVFYFFFPQRNKYKNIHSTERPPYSVRSSVWISSVCDLSLTATRQFCYVTINIICNKLLFTEPTDMLQYRKDKQNQSIHCIIHLDFSFHSNNYSSNRNKCQTNNQPWQVHKPSI